MICTVCLTARVHSSRPTVTDGFYFTGADTFILKKNKKNKNCESRKWGNI